MENFYLICPIGLEKALLKEIQLKGLDRDLSKITIEKGGIELECELSTGLALNYKLRGATRILLRLRERKCRDFPKLFKTIGQIDWRKYLVREEAEWRITSQKSRIIHTDKAKKACEDALKKYFIGQPLSKATKEKHADSPLQKVFLRFDEDMLAISIDTSGELLHIRGGSPDRGKASLRASYASCLLMELNEFAPKARTIIDPMCGTGTFLTEALDFYRPQSERVFPFERWNISAPPKETEATIQGLYEEAIGLDLEPKAPKRRELSSYVHDIFAPMPPDVASKARDSILVCNFPYGKRVKIAGDRQAYFDKLSDLISKKIRPKAYGVIVPADIRFKCEKKIPFNNNGIKVNFCMGSMN